MRSYILTEREKGILKEYLASKETSDAFWILLNRIKKSIDSLDDEIHLIRQVLNQYHQGKD